MKNKNKADFVLSWLKTKKFLIYSLLLVLMGIFLLPKAAFLSSVNEENIINLTNNERLKFSLEPLKINQLLVRAARKKGKEILSTGKFQHNLGEKQFSAWIKEAGYQYSYAGENLAIDFITSEGAMRAWLNSPTHKKNILNSNFSEIGAAVLNGKFNGNNTTLIVQIFGAPLIGSSLNLNDHAGINYSGVLNKEEAAALYGINSGQGKNIPAPVNNNSTIGISSKINPANINNNIFQALNINELTAGIKLFYIKNTGFFKLIISIFIFTVLLLFVDNLEKWPRIKNYFTLKNKQLKLPLK